MLRLEELQVHMIVKGIFVNEPVKIVDLTWHNTDALLIVFEDSQGYVLEDIIGRSREPHLELVSTPEPIESHVRATEPESPSTDKLRAGMYVRVPIDIHEESSEFRDYYIGRIQRFEEIADTVVVVLENHSPGEEPVYQPYECSRAFVRRCHILPGTPFRHTETQKRGTVLAACNGEWQDGVFCDYYVQIAGKTLRLPENELIVASHRGNPDPWTQFTQYEFHHPSFKFPRDQLVENYADLHAATYGIEDLVGSRILLMAHQAEVIAQVLSDTECRYILADEVGLGKTVEASVILKGLRRRHPDMRTLIIVPASLAAQWYYELDQKFWLRFATESQWKQFAQDLSIPGLIVSVETLLTTPQLIIWLKMQPWGLLIVDEAHHISRKRVLFEHICDLSESAERSLILSATPIQRRAQEFLSLLQLMNPTRYRALDTVEFVRMLDTQFELLQSVASLVPDLTPEYFDPDDFQDEIENVVTLLGDDPVLTSLSKQIAQNANKSDKGLQAAKALIAYIAENYRIERRVIRNRRVNLSIGLPERTVDNSYTYVPDSLERNTLNELHDYIDAFIEHQGATRHVLEYARLLLHAAFSSPFAVQDLLQKRQQAIANPIKEEMATSEWDQLATPTAPRQEIMRIYRLITTLPPAPNEAQSLQTLLWHVQRWLNQTEHMLERLPYGSTIPPLPHRLASVMRAVSLHIAQNPSAKIVVFTTWLSTLTWLKRYLVKHFSQRAVAEFHCQVEIDILQTEVDRFQNQEYCHILLCDELGGEGRNFQMADLIIHVDLPWTPANLEQRIGRVDRLGRTETVVSIVPYARNQIEHDLYRIWEDAFQLFTKSLSGLEIALEEIQDILVTALAKNSRNGLIEKLDEMITHAATLREQVEEERYYEEGAIDERRRDEFHRLSERYRDGSRLRKPVLAWATQAGLQHSYKQTSDAVRYYPRQFNLKMMRNAKFARVPNMEEALSRSRNKNNPWITGTFNRTVALLHEDLVFFAPGSDPWTDTIIENAIEADRGRSCAIRRRSDEIKGTWHGLELFYHIQVNPRPLFALGHDPIHLLRAQGYLYMPTYRLLISVEGEVLPHSHPLYNVTQNPFWFKTDTHLGQRSSEDPPLQAFKAEYPPDVWQNLLNRLFQIARKHITQEFEFTAELAVEAEETFEQSVLGMQAAQQWLDRHGLADSADTINHIETYKQISAALAAGIREPLFQVESACFWIIEPA